jgi:hypothetical protein
MHSEWPGHTSSKFNGARKHVPEPEFKEVPHPLYSTYGKKHFDKKTSNTYEWKSTIRVDPNKDAPRPER